MKYLDKKIKNGDVIRFKKLEKYPRFSFIRTDVGLQFYGRDKRKPLTLLNQCLYNIYDGVIEKTIENVEYLPYGVMFNGFVKNRNFIATHINVGKKILTESETINILTALELEFDNYSVMENGLQLNELTSENYSDVCEKIFGEYSDKYIVEVNGTTYKVQDKINKTRYKVSDENSLLLYSFLDWSENKTFNYGLRGDSEETYLKLYFSVVKDFIKQSNINIEIRESSFDNSNTKLNMELLEAYVSDINVSHSKIYQILIGNIVKNKNRLSSLINETYREKLYNLKVRLNNSIGNPITFMDYNEWKKN